VTMLTTITCRPRLPDFGLSRLRIAREEVARIARRRVVRGHFVHGRKGLREVLGEIASHSDLRVRDLRRVDRRQATGRICRVRIVRRRVRSRFALARNVLEGVIGRRTGQGVIVLREGRRGEVRSFGLGANFGPVRENAQPASLRVEMIRGESVRRHRLERVTGLGSFALGLGAVRRRSLPVAGLPLAVRAPILAPV
jgi:hypothetical protein